MFTKIKGKFYISSKQIAFSNISLKIDHNEIVSSNQTARISETFQKKITCWNE